MDSDISSRTHFRKLVIFTARILPPTYRKFGLRFILKNRFLSQSLGFHYFGVNNIDKDLDFFLKPSFRNAGFYVELGANDGITQSNSKRLELFFGWKGILIEPEPNNYLSLTRNRSKRNSFYNVAAVSFDYHKPTMELKFSNLMTTPLEGRSTIKDREKHAEEGEKFLRSNEATYRFSTKAKTLNSIFIETSAPENMDFLSLDVEGGEFEVLNGINHEKFRFHHMLIETQQFKELVDYLEPLGYSLLATLSTQDYIFIDTLRN